MPADVLRQPAEEARGAADTPNVFTILGKVNYVKLVKKDPGAVPGKAPFGDVGYGGGVSSVAGACLQVRG